MGLRVLVVLLALCGSSVVLGQTAGGGQVSSPAAARVLPSAVLQPSLDVLKTAMDEVRTDKWKGSAAVRSEAEANVGSIRRDVETTLPPLLAAADAAPDSAAKALAAYRNVEALYDVLLRVTTAARIAAPGDQSSALDQALGRLDDGRRALGDRLQTDAVTAEKRASDLQAKLAAIPPPAPPPPAPVCPAPAPAKKRAKPAAKPAAPAASPSPTATPH
jgi:hypothetical protein